MAAANSTAIIAAMGAMSVIDEQTPGNYRVYTPRHRSCAARFKGALDHAQTSTKKTLPGSKARERAIIKLLHHMSDLVATKSTRATCEKFLTLAEFMAVCDINQGDDLRKFERSIRDFARPVRSDMAAFENP